MLTLLYVLQSILLAVIFSWVITSRRIEYKFYRIKLLKWNIFSKNNNFNWVPGSTPTMGYFIWNEDKKDEIKALQPVQQVQYYWLNISIIATIKYDIYWNDKKKSIYSKTTDNQTTMSKLNPVSERYQKQHQLPENEARRLAKKYLKTRTRNKMARKSRQINRKLR